jgi:hypothetical protein
MSDMPSSRPSVHLGYAASTGGQAREDSMLNKWIEKITGTLLLVSLSLALIVITMLGFSLILDIIDRIKQH